MERVLTTPRGTGDRANGARLLVAAMLMAMPLACSGKLLDVGSDGRAAGAGGASGSPTNVGGSSSDGGPRPACKTVTDPSWPDPVSCLPAPGAAMVGKWKGHWPVNSLNGGGDALLTLQGLTADGVPCGTLSVGEGPPLPPATDPQAPYPPSAAGGVGGGPADGPIRPEVYGQFPGHDYPIIKVVAEGSRLAFWLPVNEPWRGWCGLQTPIPGQTQCLRPDNASWSTAGCLDTTGHSVSCAQVNLCVINSVCFCDGSCCDADPTIVHVVDLHWDGRAFQGSVDSSYQIYLDPVP